MKFNRYSIIIAIGLAVTGCSSGEHDLHGEHDEHEHSEGHVHGEHDEDAHEHDNGSGHGDEITLSEASAKRFGVGVEKLSPGTFNEIITVSGQIVPAQADQSIVSATTSGIVTLGRGVNVGERVAAGTNLGSISSKGISGGDPNEAQRIVIEAAKRELDRVTPLHKEDIVSDKEYNEIVERYNQARAGYSPAAAGGAIVSRSAGVITRLMVKSGEYVAVGQPIAVIAGNSRLTLRADVPEKYYNFLPTVVSANFRPDYSTSSLSLAQMGGRLISSPASSMAENGYIPVYFSFDSNGQTVPGAFAEIYLIGAAKHGAMTVPIDAVVELQGNHYVYTREHPDAYAKHLVTLGNNDGQRVEIVNGLKAGDMVVTKGAQVIRMAEVSNIAPPGHSHNH